MGNLAAFDRFALDGRCVLVTGGSVGIGRAIALAFAEAGADVAIQYSPSADAAVDRIGAAETVATSIDALGRRSLAIPASFAVAGAARQCVERVASAWGGIDVLVVCASVQDRQKFEEIGPEQVEHQVSINFKATVELLQATLPGMTASRWGRVLSIGSVNQVRPDAELAVYAALKAAQHNLIMNLAATYAGLGITLNTLSPGLIATDRNAPRRRDAAAWETIQVQANPMARAGVPDNIVGAALLLCSQAGSFITGIDLSVAGGGQL